MSGTLNADNAVLLAMQYTEKLSIKKKESLLNAVEFPAQLLSEKSAFVRTLLGESADEFFSHAAKAEEYAAIMEGKGVSWVSYLDDAYPETLRAVDMRPLMLFAKGDVGLLSTPCIAVVGTRKPTRYGLKLTDSFVREFARAGLTVVSGFARGIDGAAHKACVESGAPTIAVADSLCRNIPWAPVPHNTVFRNGTESSAGFPRACCSRRLPKRAAR